jgi:hypothetical protein
MLTGISGSKQPFRASQRASWFTGPLMTASSFLPYWLTASAPSASMSAGAMRKRPIGVRTVTEPPRAWVTVTSVPFSSTTTSPAGIRVEAQSRTR